MVDEEMFESAARSAGDRAGVFEHDGDAGYFYLYDTKGKNGQKILGAIQISTGAPKFHQEDIVIRWDSKETKVGLYIDRQLVAVFDLESGAKYGGDLAFGNPPAIPPEIENDLRL